MRLWTTALAMIAASVTVGQPSQAQRFDFAAIGDTGYSRSSEAELDRMISAMNRERLAFVFHAGDLQADPRPYERSPDRISMPCTDERLGAVVKQLNASRHPLVVTPGDNDWTDCHLLKTQRVDPLERLERLRAVLFAQPRSLGQRKLALTTQAADAQHAKFRENVTWTTSRVRFVTLHLPGSNNNLGRNTEMDKESAERTTANLAWLSRAFSDARKSNAPALVILTQANVGFETKWSISLRERYFRIFPNATVPKDSPAGGYDAILDLLADEMETFTKPVLFVHGDTHIFHVSKPLLSKRTGRFFDNFTRLEVFGDPDSHWVRVTVDPALRDVFTIKPQIVPENRTKAAP